MSGSALTRPSAVIPILMSLAALGLIAGQLILAGPARQADEGAAAHLWQLLIAGQVPVIAIFAMRWLPRAPAAAAAVLGVQAVALLAALAPVFLLGW